MSTFTIYYTQLFVSGVLEGITVDCRIRYPISSRARIEDEFLHDAASGRIIQGIGSSNYKILDFHIMEDDEI